MYRVCHECVPKISNIIPCRSSTYWFMIFRLCTFPILKITATAATTATAILARTFYFTVYNEFVFMTKSNESRSRKVLGRVPLRNSSLRLSKRYFAKPATTSKRSKLSLQSAIPEASLSSANQKIPTSDFDLSKWTLHYVCGSNRMLQGDYNHHLFTMIFLLYVLQFLQFE